MSQWNAPSPITAALVAEYLRDGPLRSLRCEEVSVVDLPGGAAHDSFVARWSGDSMAGFHAITVRINRHDTARTQEKFQQELRALTTIGGTLGPKLIAADDDSKWFGRPLMLLEFIEGESRRLREVGASELAALGAAVGRLHNTGVGGGLPHTPTTAGAVTYADHLSAWYRMELLEKPFPAQGLGRRLHERANRQFQTTNRLMDRSAESVTFRQPGSWTLLHDDLTEQNIVWANGVPRFIDWEDARIGDPAEELAYIVSEADLDEVACERVLRGYSSARSAADAEATRSRMDGWAPVVAMASIRWWLDRVVRIAAGQRGAGMAGRSFAFHRRELLTRLDRFESNWPS